MDVLANYSIFQELQLVHDTGYFSAMPSLEENWQQPDDIKSSSRSSCIMYYLRREGARVSGCEENASKSPTPESWCASV
ncbi:Krueppel-like factor 7 [Anabarilius grahami]|uniref:Krueppel-like factor 7 n=1 Tax=Anabarilius grahami TaxID=495550 RepID=A0A3N0YCK5_ANAGA|nr:Krueppel-like factor 7 [Anabarilius grahami]